MGKKICTQCGEKKDAKKDFYDTRNACRKCRNNDRAKNAREAKERQYDMMLAVRTDQFAMMLDMAEITQMLQEMQIEMGKMRKTLKKLSSA